jgi:hypothetical protein
MTWMTILAGILLAAGAYLIGYALFKRAHREDEIVDREWAELQAALTAQWESEKHDPYDQDEPFTVPTTWPVICRRCEAPLRLEEVTSGMWFWKHRSPYLDLQHRPDAVPAVTP